MKKTLIATAIAGAMSFSVAAQAAPVVYGNIQLAVDVENDNTASNNGSTLGFKGEQALDNGLTGIYKAEFEFDAGTQKTDANVKGDQAYLGVQGGFGTVRVGSFDTVANDFVHDMVYATEFATGAYTAFINGADREGQQVQYTGDFGGIKVGASVNLVGKNAADTDKENAMQVGVAAPVGPATVSVAYDTYKSAVGVGAKAEMDALTVGAKFETTDDIDSVISASASFDYGMGNVYALVNALSTDSSDLSSTTFGAAYNLGEAMYVYAEVASGDTVNVSTQTVGDAKATAIGAVLSF